jgi:hypothetical protein
MVFQHFLGKEKAGGSRPPVGSIPLSCEAADDKTQWRFMVGSVKAITASGQLISASATGGQIGPYVCGAARVIVVAGSQKIVPNLDAAPDRIRDYVQPYENRPDGPHVGERVSGRFTSRGGGLARRSPR